MAVPYFQETFMLSDADLIAANSNPKDSAIPRFFMKPVKNNFKSEQTGHPVYDTKEYVQVIIPGDRNSIPERAVKEEDKSRWARQYIAFKNNQELAPDGMPLETWPLIDIGMVETLKHWNIRSVEQLATLNDMHLQNIGMGARDLRSKAVVYLEQARDGSGVSRVVAENDKLRSDMVVMQEKLDALTEAVAKKTVDAPAPVAAAAPAAGIDPAALQEMIAASVAAALAAAAPIKPPRQKPTAAEEKPETKPETKSEGL